MKCRGKVRSSYSSKVESSCSKPANWLDERTGDAGGKHEGSGSAEGGGGAGVAAAAATAQRPRRPAQRPSLERASSSTLVVFDDSTKPAFTGSRRYILSTVSH